MSETVAEKRVRIVNLAGLHARPAAQLVKLANRFACEVEVGTDGLMVNAKSLMGVLMLAACKGTDLTLTAVGDDDNARAALDALIALIAQRFGEDR